MSRAKVVLATWSASILLLLPTLASAQPVLQPAPPGAAAESALRVAAIGEVPDPDCRARMEEVLFRCEMVHFAFDSPALTPVARRVLARKAAYLQAHRSTKVVIEGHCDIRGAVAYNQDLGRLRAESAKLYLVSQGVAAHRIRIVSHGEQHPLAPPEGEAAHAVNRRAETVPQD
jgi:peptidoglycan-associated lipoprotein